MTNDVEEAIAHGYTNGMLTPFKFCGYIIPIVKASFRIEGPARSQKAVVRGLSIDD